MSIRKRGNRAYQVRVSPFPAQTVPTREAAERLQLNLKLRRVGGAAAPERPTTLGVEINGWLDRVRAAGGLRPRSIEFYEQKAKVWTPLRGVKVSALRRAQVQDFIVARAAKHPRSAMDELQFLKRVLREAKERGQYIDDAILSIRPVKHRPRRGRALDVDQLYELASWFPEHVSRLVLLAGQVGARQAFWFSLTDDMLDLEEGTMPIPAELSKNRRDHRVYLTSFEVALLREQLLARAPGTPLVFPNAKGEQWNRSRFGELAWKKSVEAAAKSDREQNGVRPSMFDGFTFHVLRHTAGSLMALAGLDPAVASERMGHTDGGALFLRTYRHLYEGEKRIQAARLEALVRTSLDKEGTTQAAADLDRPDKAASESGRTWDRTRDLPRVKSEVVAAASLRGERNAHADAANNASPSRTYRVAPTPR
jgi:integrase